MLMMTATERQYVDLALDALAQVKDEKDLVIWNDCFCGDRYLHLPQEGIHEIERAYRDKECEFLGVGA